MNTDYCLYKMMWKLYGWSMSLDITLDLKLLPDFNLFLLESVRKWSE